MAERSWVEHLNKDLRRTMGLLPPGRHVLPMGVSKVDADRRRRIRNDLRARLHTDPEFAHVWLCHGGVNSQCPVEMGTGPECNHQPEPERLRFYESELEVPQEG